MKGYKVVVIDDEEVSADGIRMLVERSEFPLNVEAVFYSSIESLKYLQEHPVDIVITDINMPELSGLELIENIRAIHPAMRFIIFTGFGNLDYAKQAMSFGIRHFLLKPCSGVELNKSLSECIDDLQNTHEDTILRQKELIKRRILEDVLDVSQKSNIVFDLVMYPENFYKELHPQMMKLLKDNNYGFSNINGAIVYYILEKKPITDQLKELADLNAELRTILFYKENQNLNTVRDSFLLGRRYFDRSFYLSATEMASKVTEQTWMKKDERWLTNNLKEIDFLIEMNNITEARRAFVQLKEKAEEGQIPSEYYVRRIEDFCNVVMQKYQIECKEILADGVKQPMYAVNYEEVFAFFFVMMHFVLEKSDEVMNERGISAKLNWIIETYYQNKELSLRWISKNILYLNPEYLGKIYLKETAQKFSFSLLKFRMKKSIELLDKGFRISEVADLVGYENPDYFGQQFKKTYACTPREYMNREK